MNRKTKDIIKLCIFLIIANLPFITIVQHIGLDLFLDSFDNPSSYLYFDDPEKTINYNLTNGQYLIFQKSSHPDFKIEQKDIILYCKDNGELICQKVYNIKSIGSIKYYHTKNEKNIIYQDPIYDNQIIGKVIRIVDGNIWNKISMNIWDASIKNFNVKSFI